MKISRVEVEHFACIRRATVELGPGLNVLFGPNDLGKSTLARAIRAGLLLPHTSSTVQDFIEWESDENPSVKLTLELPDRRIWRIEKRFGSSGGSSMLRESTDGRTFSPYKKAREVDEEIRTMLGWGIASPATKGAPRGLPASFLSQVLLGEQSDIAAVLQQTLEQDTDESGRERLTSALAGFAQDPLFKSILEEAQGKVDLAFTVKGQRKRGRTSPFREVTDEVKRMKEELERLTKRVDVSENARRELETCNAELLRRQEIREQAVGRRDVLRRAKARFEELSRATHALEEQKGEVETLRKYEARLRKAVAEVDQGMKEQQTLASAKDEVSMKEKAAEEALRRVKSSEAEQARQLRRGELEKRNLELDAALKTLEADRSRVTKARSFAADLEKAKARAAELEEVREQSERAGAIAATEERAGERQLELLEVAVRLSQRRRTESTIGELEQVRAEVEADREKARQHRGRARGLLESVPGGWPDGASVAAMKRLAHELEVAEAKLGGGLAVLVERFEPVGVRATADGSELDVPTDGRVSFEATRGFTLQIDETARISVTAGEKEARESEASLRRRWEEEIAPVVKHHGASGFASFLKLVGEIEVVNERANEAERAAVALEQRASAREEQLAKMKSLREELAAIDRELGDRPVDTATELLDEVGDSALDERCVLLKQELTAAQNKRASAERTRMDADTEARVLAERISATEKGVAELSSREPDDGWGHIEERLARRAKELHDQKVAISGELETRCGERTAEVRAAEAELAEVRRVLVAADAELQDSTEALVSLRGDARQLEGAVEARRSVVAKLDIDAATRRVAEATTCLDALPVSKEEVTEDGLRQTELEVEEAARAYERALDAARKAEGALRTVGGQVVLEEQAAVREALRQAERNEREAELEYDAWWLLAKKLREAENNEGKHLGEALSQPISERFAELTASRYGKLEVAPNLGAEGLLVAGVLRDICTLSVGTQEQLAFLLRLTVAEQLQSTLVLDDHLTQTDHFRSVWFRKVLRDHAAKTQVIVLTCHPEDYLRTEELPADGDATAAGPGGIVRATDLSLAIERSSPSAPAHRAGEPEHAD